MKILIAKDEAFNFIYRANIDSLARKGDVCFFSPLHDRRMEKCDLLYLPGGYPELYLKEITGNPDMMKYIRDYAENDGRIYAECGGFMYLCNNIDDTPMCGILPFKATMQNARLHLGYRQMEINAQVLNMQVRNGEALNGEIPNEENDKEKMLIKGHEFHYSDVVEHEYDGIKIIRNQYSAKGTKVNTAIYEYRNVVAGYTHWYWAEHGFPFF